ncbi:MAG: type II toxin-antitoxin system prevent-host-death family antitoxin [Chloroflexi bacterium]|nr:MAG: type II toxin-antitoxin system prevent-host-death family antitoxin [Chloroflexota bacterium]
MVEVSIRELKSRLSEHLRRLESGESITVTRRGKPVAVITRADEEHRPAEQSVEQKMLELVRRGVLVNYGGRPYIPKKLVRLRGKGPTMSEMVLQDRG